MTTTNPTTVSALEQSALATAKTLATQFIAALGGQVALLANESAIIAEATQTIAAEAVLAVASPTMSNPEALAKAHAALNQLATAHLENAAPLMENIITSAANAVGQFAEQAMTVVIAAAVTAAAKQI